MSPRYGFVGGLHRSGTSLLARCLAAHPEATAFAATSVWEDEGQHLQDVLPAARVLGGPGRFARHPAARGRGIPVEEAESLRARLLATWEPLWRPGAQVRIAKSPPNMMRGPLLQAAFPSASLLVIRRHPLAVALATRRMSRALRSLDLADLVEHWVIAHDALRQDAPDLRRLVVLDHRALVANPREALAPAFAALELEPVDPPEPLVDTDARYREEWRAVTRSSRARRDLLPRLEALEPAVRAHGYSLRGFEDDSSPMPPSLSAR